MAGARFTIAGWLLLCFALCRGARWPDAGEWLRAAAAGGLMLAAGNGLLVWAEREVTSSAAALVIATTPLWFVLLEWMRRGGTAPRRQAWVGLGVGFVGVATLALRHSSGDTLSASPRGLAVLLIASFAWALGSMAARSGARPRSPWTFSAAQMICGGGIGLAVAAASGELATVRLAEVSTRSALALGYLIVFGSWVGYSAYVWLLRVEPAGRVATYAYVNPIVAVALGWQFGGETLTERVGVAGALIVIGVFCLVWPAREANPLPTAKRIH